MDSELQVIEQCRLAIEVFWQTRAIDEDRDYTQKATSHGYSDGKYLSEFGDEGLRYGVYAWPDLKLRFRTDRGFYLDSNGMESNDFDKFQDLFASELAAVGLRFHRMNS